MSFARKIAIALALGAGTVGLSACASDGYYGRDYGYYSFRYDSYDHDRGDRYWRHHKRHDGRRHHGRHHGHHRHHDRHW